MHDHLSRALALAFVHGASAEELLASTHAVWLRTRFANDPKWVEICTQYGAEYFDLVYLSAEVV